MARKERNDIDYFPHSVNHGKKMFYIRSKFGNDGYAVWFMLLEELGKSTHHYLMLGDEIQLMYLSSEFKVSELVLEEIINALVKLGEFDKELWEESGVLYNQKFVDNISDAYKKRNNNCIDRNSLEELLIAKGIRKPPKSNPKPPKATPKGDGNPQSKLNYSKEEESIEEEKPIIFNFKKSLLDLGVEKDIVSDWLKVRSKKGASNTKTAFKAIKSQIQKTNKSANECIKIAVEKDWKGFEASWLNNIKTTHPSHLSDEKRDYDKF